MERMNESPGWKLLSAEQRIASERLLSEESPRRAHLVVSLSGAHAYGFPSPDSDVDLKAIHIAPTSRLVGLEPEPQATSRMEWIGGVEVDYSSNEIGGVLHGLLKGNGNYLERILGAAAMSQLDTLESLKPLAVDALSKRFHRHYRGFAHSQRLAFDEKPTAKRLLYVLRTTLTGTHLLHTGRLVVDVRDLLDDYRFSDARILIEVKTRGEQSALSPDQAEHWAREAERAFALLDAALAQSPLPDDPRNSAAIEAWLIALRREHF
jgi:predicted nucleotidyltransferase